MLKLLNMTNENNNTSLTEKETGINREFFEGLIKNANHLSEEDKKKIGEFKDFKNDTVGEVLKVEDKDKIAAYDKLNVKNLPEDWELKLARLKYLEGELSNYEKVKGELKTWTDTFGDKKPGEIQGEIKKLEEEKQEKEKELGEKISELEKTLETSNSEKREIINKLEEKNKELEGKVKDWNNFFGGKELEEVKEELQELRKRPDTNISTEEFYNDYAQRKSKEQNELDEKELEKEREKVEEYKKKFRELFFAVNKYIKVERIKRYQTAKPVLTIKEAGGEIANLLEETEQRLSNYLENKNISDENANYQNSVLGLTLWQKDKEEKARKVLEWIREARVTLDYEKLYERWSDGKKYSEEDEFDDGTLALLKRLLEFKDFETPL